MRPQRILLLNPSRKGIETGNKNGQEHGEAPLALGETK